MANVLSIGKLGEEHNAFVKDILTSLHSNPLWLQFSSLISKKFIESITCGKFLLPSTFIPVICKVSDKILSDKDGIRKELLILLQQLNVENSTEMLECFVCQFVLEFGELMVKFICNSVVGEKPKRTKEIKQFDIEDRQCIFYIGGSVMRGFIRMAYRHKTNKDWCAILETIRTRIEEGDGVQRAAEGDRAWTEERNRKSLFFMGALAMDFFVSLTQILYNIESDESGNFKDETVINAVYEDSVTIILWDELVGTSLSSSLSVRFLKGVVKSFTQTYGRGVGYKKLNSHLKKAYAAITLRHSVAPRQST